MGGVKRSARAGWRVGRAAVAVATALALTGCADPTGPTGEYDELCVNEETQERAPDDWCEDDDEHHHHAHAGHGFVYVPYMHGQPNPVYPVGSRVVGGSSVRPVSGSFVRGGFGGVRGGTGGG